MKRDRIELAITKLNEIARAEFLRDDALNRADAIGLDEIDKAKVYEIINAKHDPIIAKLEAELEAI